MVLAVDIGNTNVVLGYFQEDTIQMIGRLATNRQATELEYAMEIYNLLKLAHMDRQDFEGCILCSVVPVVTGAMKRALQIVTQKRVMVVGAGLKTGLNIRIDQPAQLGADRVADAVGAVNQYPCPLITIDMGTATTVGVVDENRNFIGGMIVPGVLVSLNSLASGASQLPFISLDPPSQPIGKNTIDCMRSGIVYHNAAGIDGMIQRIQEQLGTTCTVVVTGGLAGVITPYCKSRVIYDELLLLKGLRVIYEKNK